MGKLGNRVRDENGEQRKERDKRRGGRKKREAGEGKEKEMREEGVGMEVGIH